MVTAVSAGASLPIAQGVWRRCFASQPSCGLTGEEVRQHCRRHLADYKMPRRVFLVDAIERIITGKPDDEWAKAMASDLLAAG